MYHAFFNVSRFFEVMAARQRILSTFRTPQRNVTSSSVAVSTYSTPRRPDGERRAQLGPGTSRNGDETPGSEFVV